MLGRLDEAMKVQTQLMDGLEDGPKAEAGMPSSPIVMMDYKEHGYRSIVPEEHLTHAKDQLSKAPDSLDALKSAISTFSLAGKHETVLELIEDWMKHASPTADLLSSAAHAARNLERWQTALDYLDRALALDGSKVSNWMERAEILNQLGKRSEAIAALKELLKHDPKHVMAHITLGHYYAEQEKNKDALKEFQEAARLDAQNAMAFYNLGTIYLKLEDRMKAVEALEKCIKFDKDFVEAYNTLAGIYFYFAQVFQFVSSENVPAKSAAELLEKAQDLWDGAIRINPKYARAWFTKGQLLEYKGELPAALDAFRQAVGIDPNYRLAIDAIKRLSS
jgi:tetratricopeptide (TPR) repeat protein